MPDNQEITQLVDFYNNDIIIQSVCKKFLHMVTPFQFYHPYAFFFLYSDEEDYRIVHEKRKIGMKENID